MSTVCDFIQYIYPPHLNVVCSIQNLSKGSAAVKVVCLT